MRENEVRVQVSFAKVRAKRVGLDVKRGKADAADGDAVALFEFLRRLWRFDGDAVISAVLNDADYRSDFFNQSSKHDDDLIKMPATWAGYELGTT